MLGAFRLAVAVLAGSIVCSCSSGSAPPAPPRAPDLTGRVVPRPPGSDDFARRSFASPLSLQDAEAILRHSRVFAFGGMPPKRQVQAFNVVFEQPDAVSRFQTIGRGESAAGRLYALAALLLLDRSAVSQLQAALSAESDTIRVHDSDVMYEMSVRELAAVVHRRTMGTSFRLARDETNAYFGRPQ